MKKTIQIMTVLLCLYGGENFAQFNAYLSSGGEVIIDKKGGINGEINFYNVSPSSVDSKPIENQTISKTLFGEGCKSGSNEVTFKFKNAEGEVDITLQYVYDCEKKSLKFIQDEIEIETLYFSDNQFIKKPDSNDGSIDSTTNVFVTDEETNQSALRNAAKSIIKKGKFTVLKGQNNLVLDKNGNIVVFIDSKGLSLYNDYPKTGRENYDKYVFYVLTLESGDYYVRCEGDFVPVKLSDEIDEVGSSGNATATGETLTPKKVYVYQSDVFGPYTDSFDMILTDGSNIITKKTITLLPVKRISVGTSVISTWLKNPENIETFTKSNGELTLIADDPSNRGFLGLFLTFHLSPRNLDVEPRNAMERLGISVGTNLSDRSFNNFFLGLNYEVRNGLYINGGIHYGRINTVIGYDDFDFGHDVFEGTLSVKKDWKIGGPYISINIDTDVFGKVFKNLLGPSGKS